MIYMGRKDTQIEIRGQRIELADIEHHVRRALSQAEDVIVEMITQMGSHTALAAFVSWR